MAPPVRCELVSRGRAVCRILADALHEVILNRLPCVRGKWGQFSGPPLPCPYPFACPLPCLSRHTPRDRSLAGRPSHPRALPGGGRDHSAVVWAMTVGVEPRLERRNLIPQPIQPPPALGSTRHAPNLALTLSLAHLAVRRLRRLRDGPLMERQDAAGQRSWWLRLGGLAQLGSAGDGALKTGPAGGPGASRERFLRSKRVCRLGGRACG